jgi:Uma2 family endonuclease
MTSAILSQSSPETELYPSDDGAPMAESTLQYEWIVLIKENLERLFANDGQVFVAGDLLWYPVPASAPVVPRYAPDVMVVMGRPKGMRKSYIQHREGGIAPQVVFEVLSDSNKTPEGRTVLADKFAFYQQYGVEEYYIYDPELRDFSGYQRRGNELVPIPDVSGWVSPRLKIRFDWGMGEELALFFPDGERFVNTIALAGQRDWERQQRIQAEDRLARLREQLQGLGIDVDDL